MSLLLNHHFPNLCFRKPVLVRSSSLPPAIVWLRTPPCLFGNRFGYLVEYSPPSEKKVSPDLVYCDINDDRVGTIGASHGWIATLKNDGILRLQDDLNPIASETDPKHIPLPSLLTLPHCQTNIVTNVSMSLSSPEDENCVVAVKFLGPQLSFCRPAQTNPNPDWINIKIQNRCFFSSRVMFSKKDSMFRILGSGGHLVGSWDLYNPKKKPKIQKLRFQNLPDLTKTERELLHSCSTSEHLVESRPTGETFLLKWYRKPPSKLIEGMPKMKTEAVMVFKLDEKGNAVYTNDIGDLCIFLSKSEPFCLLANSFPPGLFFNNVYILDVDEFGLVELSNSKVHSQNATFVAPFFIPPQHIE